MVLDPNAPVMGRVGSLETRLARIESEVAAAQRLRYAVFYDEMGAIPKEGTVGIDQDADEFDPFCDHLLVVDTAGEDEKVVGTYRLLTQTNALKIGKFYTQSEFDILSLLQENQDAKFLELGRSCILPDYRNKRTMELLWHGTWSYAVTHKTDIMFGCASFEGTDPEPFASAFAWLNTNTRLPENEAASALGPDYIDLRQFNNEAPNPRAAMKSMPPLLKGYLRLGARIGSHAAIDHQFGTIDVLVVLKVAQINPRYLAHYGNDASRFAVGKQVY